MIIVMQKDSRDKDIQNISQILESLGLGVHILKGTERTIIGVIGDKQLLNNVPIDLMPELKNWYLLLNPTNWPVNLSVRSQVLLM